MILELEVAGISMAPFLTPGTLNLMDAINQRSVLSFSLTAPVGILSIAPGQRVTLAEAIGTPIDYGLVTVSASEEIDYGSVTESVSASYDYGSLGDLFSGTIDQIEKFYIGAARERVGYRVMVADNHAIFDRRYVAESVVNSTVGNFIADVLFPEYIEDEGITLGVIDGYDITIDEAVFSYESITKVLDKLAAKTGYIWYINPDMAFHFTVRDGEAAIMSITESSPISNLRVIEHREQYRNKQVIKDGTSETDSQTETFVADGEQNTFVVAFPLLHAPTITLNAAVKSVGIRGLDEGKDFYWNKGRNEINAELAPGTGDIVAITYIGRFDVVVEYSNIAEILARKAIEGGTGLYEAVESKTGLSTLTALTDIAFERIRQFGSMGKKVSFTTRTQGVQAGQIIPVDLPDLGINAADMLIMSVQLNEQDAINEYAYSITAVTGEAVGGWSKFFRDWLQPDEPIELVNQNQILTINKVVSKTWLEAESPNIFYTLYPADDLFPAADLLPMFHPGEEVRYVDVLIDGVSSVRSARVLYERVGDVITTRFLLQSEVVGNITGINYFGDNLADIEIASGTLVDSEAYSQAKTKFDIIQIIRTDTKGW